MEDKTYSAWEEWMIQSEYDFETAEAMLRSDRMVYVVFFCHLSIEKHLKSLWVKKFNSVPPKTHNIIFLLDQLQLTDNKCCAYLKAIGGYCYRSN